MHRSCVRSGKGRGGGGGGGRGHGGQFTSPKWSGQGGGRDPLSGLKSVTP